MSDLEDVFLRGRRGEALLRDGCYAEGFRLVDEAWRIVQPREWLDLPLPRWRGEDLRGRRFLISGEQGLGDQIMYARFARLLQARGAEVVWISDRRLSRLFTLGMGLTAGAQDELPDGLEVSFYAPAGTLPAFFFPPLTAPPAEPYIAVPPRAYRPGARIGVATRGDPAHLANHLRCLPDPLAAQLLALPGVVSLHPEDTGVADFYDTAEIVAGLDLVISVDTSVAHLAGAMGKPVWVLLSSVWSDWRWQKDRTDSPWYPSARLYRQAVPGDWAGVLERVMTDLGARQESARWARPRLTPSRRLQDS